MSGARLSRKEVAALIGVCDDTLANWARKRGHDFPKPLPRTERQSRRYYDRDAVEAWLASRAENAPADGRAVRTTAHTSEGSTL